MGENCKIFTATNTVFHGARSPCGLEKWTFKCARRFVSSVWFKYENLENFLLFKIYRFFF